MDNYKIINMENQNAVKNLSNMFLDIFNIFDNFTSHIEDVVIILEDISPIKEQTDRPIIEEIIDDPIIEQIGDWNKYTYKSGVVYYEINDKRLYKIIYKRLKIRRLI